MRRKPSAKVASSGVTHTKLTVEDELEWLFRERPTEHYGRAAERYDVSWPTAKRGAARYRRTGPAGMADWSSRPRLAYGRDGRRGRPGPCCHPSVWPTSASLSGSLAGGGIGAPRTSRSTSDGL
jgi:hypothetical protein